MEQQKRLTAQWVFHSLVLGRGGVGVWVRMEANWQDGSDRKWQAALFWFSTLHFTDLTNNCLFFPHSYIYFIYSSPVTALFSSDRFRIKACVSICVCSARAWRGDRWRRREVYFSGWEQLREMEGSQTTHTVFTSFLIWINTASQLAFLVCDVLASGSIAESNPCIYPYI